MNDVRRQRDFRSVPIDKVGVKGLHYPVVLLDKTRRRQHTVALINMYVSLPQTSRGTYMGRFVEILKQYHDEIDIHKLGAILREMKQRLEAQSAHLEMEFPYFIEKKAPVSGAQALMDYRCSVGADLGGKFRLRIGAAVPVTTLCPCSKEMVGSTGHNQRAEIRVTAELDGFFWLEDLIELVEGCGSSEVYSLLEREDEKHVTNLAFENPAMVEDVVRNVASRLKACKEIAAFEVEVESFESIHHHEAYAYIKGSGSDR